MSYISTATSPHHRRAVGIKEHGNLNAYSVFKHELVKANKYRNISTYVLKCSRGYRLTSITQSMSLSHLFWTANSEKRTAGRFTFPSASVSPDDMSAAPPAALLPELWQLPLLCRHCFLSQSRISCLKSLLDELKPSLACMQRPRASRWCTAVGRIPRGKLAWVCCPVVKGKSLEWSLYTPGVAGKGFPNAVHHLRRGSCAGQSCSPAAPPLLQCCSANFSGSCRGLLHGKLWISLGMQEKPSRPHTNQTELEIPLNRLTQSITDMPVHGQSSLPCETVPGLFLNKCQDAPHLLSNFPIVPLHLVIYLFIFR